MKRHNILHQHYYSEITNQNNQFLFIFSTNITKYQPIDPRPSQTSIFNMTCHFFLSFSYFCHTNTIHHTTQQQNLYSNADEFVALLLFLSLLFLSNKYYIIFIHSHINGWKINSYKKIICNVFDFDIDRFFFCFVFAAK